MTAIAVRHLTKQFGAVIAVEDLGFEASPGRVTAFLGPNGSGKTTTVRVLLGLAAPTAGTALFDGRPYAELAHPMRTVGAAITSDAFHPGRSAAAHLHIVAAAARLGRERVEQTLAAVGLGDVAGQRVGQFSLGMRQRLALATALLGDPAVLVLDEPLNGLDPDGISWLRALLRRFAAEGRTVLLSSHFLSEVAQTVDDVVIINRGRLVKSAPLDQLGGQRRTVIRATDPDRLTVGLTAAGYNVERVAPDTLTVNAPADAVGAQAARIGVTVLELAEQHDGLEQLFRELTTSEVPS